MNFQKKILVIDGDQNFGKEIKKSLAFHKYDVCYSSNGATGIKKAFEYNPDIILCDINIYQMDGYQAYNILRDSFLLKKIPFVFLKQNANMDDVRHGLNLGADDFFSKPIVIDELVQSIEIRIRKFKTKSLEVSHEFNTLFQLSPNGIIVFSENAVLKSNVALKALLKIDRQNPENLSLEDLFENLSLQRIKSWIQNAFQGGNAVFNDKITIKDTLGVELKMNLVITEFDRHSEIDQFIGVFFPIPQVNSYVLNNQLSNELFNLLKSEKITISDDLEEKITNIIKQNTVGRNNQNKSFFTRRENQVLFLSMEGYPIKIIADKLSLSTRTVEKYRTKLIEKAGANNIVEVIVFALKNDLIQI